MDGINWSINLESILHPSWLFFPCFDPNLLICGPLTGIMNLFDRSGQSKKSKARSITYPYWSESLALRSDSHFKRTQPWGNILIMLQSSPLFSLLSLPLHLFHMNDAVLIWRNRTIKGPTESTQENIQWIVEIPELTISKEQRITQPKHSPQSLLSSLASTWHQKKGKKRAKQCTFIQFCKLLDKTTVDYCLIKAKTPEKPYIFNYIRILIQLRIFSKVLNSKQAEISKIYIGKSKDFVNSRSPGTLFSRLPVGSTIHKINCWIWKCIPRCPCFYKLVRIWPTIWCLKVYRMWALLWVSEISENYINSLFFNDSWKRLDILSFNEYLDIVWGKLILWPTYKCV